MQLRNLLIDGLQGVFPLSGGVLLTNYPNHSNVGDLAIALAELEYFQMASDLEVKVATNYGKISGKWIDKNEIKAVAVQGGGSFGQLWAREDKSRRSSIEVANSFRAKFVQFPQSVNFSKGIPVQTLNAMRAYENKHIFVRDSPSQQKLHKEGIECHLVPDMFHLLELQNYFAPPIRYLQIVRRNDKESQGRLPSIEFSQPSWDWKSIAPFRSRSEKSFRRFKHTGASFLNLEKSNIVTAKAGMNYAHKMVMNGIKRLSESEIVITDRLHVALLAAHGNRKTRLVTDKYSKIQDYFETWGPIENVRIYNRWEDALRNP
jgi:pyruvyl transferase EpsO